MDEKCKILEYVKMVMSEDLNAVPIGKIPCIIPCRMYCWSLPIIFAACATDIL